MKTYEAPGTHRSQPQRQSEGREEVRLEGGDLRDPVTLEAEHVQDLGAVHGRARPPYVTARRELSVGAGRQVAPVAEEHRGRRVEAGPQEVGQRVAAHEPERV